MIHYHPNNIIFRIASSDAISKFKSLQADSFIQVARRDLQFNSAAREVLLLEYDRMSKVIFLAEHLCTYIDNRSMPKNTIDTIKASCREELINAETVFCSYTDIFLPEITNFIKVVHDYSNDIMSEKLDACIDLSLERGFEKIITTISDYLQHILLALHEINSAYIMKSAPFLTLSNFDTSGSDNQHFLPIIRRAEELKSLGCGNCYTLKNYMLHDDGDVVNELDIFERANAAARKINIFLVREAIPASEALVAYG